jgi:hypothetical protein
VEDEFDGLIGLVAVFADELPARLMTNFRLAAEKWASNPFCPEIPKFWP